MAKKGKRSQTKEKLLKKEKKIVLNGEEGKKESKKDIDVLKNFEPINRLIKNSEDTLKIQNDLLDQYEDLSKRVTACDYELNRKFNKAESDDFIEYFEKYSKNLDSTIKTFNQLESNSDNLKCKL